MKRLVFFFAAFWIAGAVADDRTLVQEQNQDQARPLPRGQFVNPIAEGADPCVVKDGEVYLWCQSEGNRGISIWVSDRPNTMGTKHVIWRSPDKGPLSQQIWAPEIVKLSERWYIYFAASDGKNENHRTYVLASKTGDPLGEYQLEGPLYTGDDWANLENNLWAIDMTVLEHRGKLYAIWSGWSTATSDQQYLYIAPMSSPTMVAGSRVLLCDNDDYLWERIEEKEGTRGLSEAPQVLRRSSQESASPHSISPESSSSNRTFIVYSCAASWLPTYKLGMLELVGEDPLDASAWKKYPQPVFRSTPETYGVGHGSFVRSPDNQQWWHIYHAKQDRRPGWRRTLYLQPMSWTDDGLPLFGQPERFGRPLALPSGTPKTPPITGRALTFDFKDETTLGRFDRFGHHQMIGQSDDGVFVGRAMENAVNPFRSGEKLVLRDAHYTDAEITATFSFIDGDRDVGILFRTSGPAVGFDAQRGYFAGLIPRHGTVVLGKTDGKTWHHLRDAKVDFDREQTQRLRVRAIDDLIEVYVGDSDQPILSQRDEDYPDGTIGVRVVNTHANFHQLSVVPR